MRVGGQILLIIAFALALIGEADTAAVQAAGAAAAPPLQGAQLAMASPASCPLGGCAAGQRLNMRFDFQPSGYDPALSPNVKVCVYAPTGWAVDGGQATVDAAGQITGKPYTKTAGCSEDPAPPAGYSPVFSAAAQLEANTFGDALGFGFRLGSAATGSGVVLARLFALQADGSAQQIQQAASAPTLNVIPIDAQTQQVYVANDAGVCGTASPCYVNSGDDLPGGLGTGLKDAVDALVANGRVTVLGSYTIKSNTVRVNKALTIAGLGDSRITFNGPGACDQPMLSLERAVTLRELNITDGACTNPNRTLVVVDSTEPVTIERNDLTGGSDAILVRDNPGADGSDLIRIVGNNITGNQGFAIRAEGFSNNQPFEITANNLHSNRAGAPVDCGATATGPLAGRKANHNYWGSGSIPWNDTHCAVDPNKRLGLPAVLEPFAPGVRVRRVRVTEQKQYLADFDNQIAFQRTGGGDFDLYVVDHGYTTPGGPPFSYAQGIESPSPCSNYWDVFLPDGVNPGGALELFFKYDRSPGCQATINSNQYCDQLTTPSNYPLYWFDPSRGSQARWITTGSEFQSGAGSQTTTCNTALNEIHVSIDNSGRPNLSQDLNYTPFMVGIPVIRSFLPLASSQTVTVTWATNNEPELVGFYVWRGPDLDHMSPITDLIPRTGSALVGRTYSIRDDGRVNGVTYVYRLQVLRADGSSFFSDAYTIVPNIPTITPTPTTAPTWTPFPTVTPFPTLRPTQFPTRIPTATRRVIAQVTPSATRLVLSTLTPTLDFRTPGAEETARAIIRTNQAAAIQATRSATARTTTPAAGQDGLTGTPISALLSQTPEFADTPTLTPLADTGTPTVTATPSPPAETPGAPGAGPTGGQASPWLSLMLGLLAGAAATGAVAGLWYLFRLRPRAS